MTPPDDLVPVIGHPEYAINPAGEVWRLTRDRPNKTYPVPRRLYAVMLGRNGSRTPHFRFDVRHSSKPVTRSLAQLMAEHFPPAPPVRAVVYAPTMERA